MFNCKWKLQNPKCVVMMSSGYTLFSFFSLYYENVISRKRKNPPLIIASTYSWVSFTPFFIVQTLGMCGFINILLGIVPPTQ